VSADVKTQEDTERIDKWIAWAKENRRRLTIAGGAVVLVAAGVWFAVSAKARRETFARRELDQARISAEAGNLPLAANDLSGIISKYGGTGAAEEARLLLAQVRMLQGQAALAATDLQAFVSEGPKPQYRSQAYDMLGVALEQTDQFHAAAQAYETGAKDSEFGLVSVRMLLDAGRAYTVAGDTADATRIYEQIIKDHGSATGAVAEAKLRLGELGRFDAQS
jgi:predicted negative regulator of RcsB-dependent stress response